MTIHLSGRHHGQRASGIWRTSSWLTAWVAFSALTGLAHGGTAYTLTILPGEDCQPRGINKTGTIVGRCFQYNDEHTRVVKEVPVVWDNTGLRTLPTLGGAMGSADALNNKGVIVGGTNPTGTSGISSFQATRWDGTAVRGLNARGSTASRAWAVNDAGDVVGQAYGVGDQASFYRAARWQGAKRIDLGTLGGDFSAALGVNRHGVIVGSSTLASGVTHAALWMNGSLSDLGTLGGPSSQAHGLNDAGQLVGDSDVADGATHAVLWDAGQMVDLHPTAAFSSSALAINNKGTIVGQAQFGNPSSRAVIWQEGKFNRLNHFRAPDASQWELIRAVGVNDRGWIIGEARRKSQNHPRLYHGFLLVPTP
jgi:probable HAF family extracellular repeat protein